MSPKGNETFKNYLELEIPKKKNVFFKSLFEYAEGFIRVFSSFISVLTIWRSNINVENQLIK